MQSIIAVEQHLEPRHVRKLNRRRWRQCLSLWRCQQVRWMLVERLIERLHKDDGAKELQCWVATWGPASKPSPLEPGRGRSRTVPGATHRPRRTGDAIRQAAEQPATAGSGTGTVMRSSPPPLRPWFVRSDLRLALVTGLGAAFGLLSSIPFGYYIALTTSRCSPAAMGTLCD